MAVYIGNERVSVYSGGTPSDSCPTDIIPQVICAANHLRDIVIEDGIAYARVGFYHDYDMEFTISEQITVDKLIVIGSGGSGGLTDGTNGGGPGFAGEKIEKLNFTLVAGRYVVDCDYGSATTLRRIASPAYINVLTAHVGADGMPGGGNLKSDDVSSVSPIAGTDGYYTDLMPSIVRLRTKEARTGAGIGAGGAGSGTGGYLLPNDEYGNSARLGLLGGVLLYVKLR